MVHRAVNILLQRDRFENEIRKIEKIADINGYQKNLIEQLVETHTRKKWKRGITTLKSNSEKFTRRKIQFHNNTSDTLKKNVENS